MQAILRPSTNKGITHNEHCGTQNSPETNMLLIQFSALGLHIKLSSTRAVFSVFFQREFIRDQLTIAAQ